MIAVAILTTGAFDATTVDHSTVVFEGAREVHIERKSGVAHRHEADVDGDSETDLVLHFQLRDTTLTCGSVAGTLTGKTFSGRAIKGSDTVRMVKGSHHLPAATKSEAVDINSASADDELKAINGIGGAYARKITRQAPDEQCREW
jgi:DNA uptake protein ComE-like DNA-binding protein